MRKIATSLRKTSRAHARHVLGVALGSTALALGILSPALATPARASTLDFPMTMWDYDADNVLFEYDLGGSYDPARPYTGNGTYSLLGWLGRNSPTGLVESNLGPDGTPVYTRAAVESAANMMAAELADESYLPSEGYTAASGKQVKPSELFVKLRQNLVWGKASEEEQTTLLGTDDDGNRAFDLGWNAEDVANAKAEGSALYDGDREWSLDAYGTLVSYTTDQGSVVSKTVSVPRASSAQTYQLWGETKSGGSEYVPMEVRVSVDGNVACDWQQIPANAGTMGHIDFQVPAASSSADESQVTVSFRSAGTTSDGEAGELRQITLQAANADGTWTPTSAAWYFMDETNNGSFATDGSWDFPADLTLYDGKTLAGQQLWTQAGDGVRSAKGNTHALSKAFTFKGGELLSYNLWLDGGDDPLQVSFEANGQELASVSTKGMHAGWLADNLRESGDSAYVRVPGNRDEDIAVTVRLTPSDEAVANGSVRVGNLKLQGHGAAAIGDYDETVRKFSDPSRGLNDVSTCMDYCYYVLNHLWQTTTDSGSVFGAGGSNVKVDAYDNIVLSEDNEADDEGHTGMHTFKAGIKYYGQEGNRVIYDRGSHTICNDASGADVPGFFPLDFRGENARTGVILDDDGNNILTGGHNYHFALMGASKFVYHAGSGQIFKFEGDDDTYLFINGRLALDLGGAHPAQAGEVSLDDHAEELGLVDGQVIPFKFFYLERHTDQSNLEISTNIELVAEDDPDPVTPTTPATPTSPGGDTKPSDGDGSDTDGDGNADAAKPASDKRTGALPQTGDGMVPFVPLVLAGVVCIGAATALRRRG